MDDQPTLDEQTAPYLEPQVGGVVIDCRYRLGRQLGSGGMSKV